MKMKNIKVIIDGEVVYEYDNSITFEERYSTNELKEILSEKFDVKTQSTFYYQLNKLIEEGYVKKIGTNKYVILKKF